MNDTVVAIVGAFFIIGIAAGVIAVIAMSALRAHRGGGAANPGRPGDRPDHEARGPGGPGPDLSWDDTVTDGHPRWPRDADTDFSGR